MRDSYEIPQVRPTVEECTARATARTERTADAASVRIYAKTSSAPSLNVGMDIETGEVFEIKHGRDGNVLPPQKTPENSRWERWALKSVVNGLLPTSRTSKCMKWRVPDRDIELIRGRETGKAYYHGLQVCSSVWMCPVCAAKISERRRAELVSAMAVAKAKGWKVYLATLTIPHGLGDDLPEILEKMHKAANKLTSTRSGVKLRQSIGLRGTIRNLETTYGENGFHPHFHVLYFIDPAYDVGPKDVEFGLCNLWQNACVKSGLPMPDSTHGCRVDDGSKAAAYCSKWGLESEMTKSHMKNSRGKKGRSMWDLLRAVLADKSDKQSAAIFCTFANAFKGKRQLVWSKGLKKLLAVVEKSDEQLAQEEADDIPQCLARFTDDEWRVISRTGSESLLLDLAEKAPQIVSQFVRDLVERWGRTDRAGRQAEPTAGPGGTTPPKT